MDSVYTFLDPARGFLNEVSAFLPRLALALLTVAAGWFLAKAVRFAVERGLRAINFNVLTSRAGMDEFMQQGGTHSDTTTLFGFLAFCLVVLASLVVAFNTLGLTYATDLLGRLVLFVPKLMLALLILTLGSYFCALRGPRRGEPLPRIERARRRLSREARPLCRDDIRRANRARPDQHRRRSRAPDVSDHIDRHRARDRARVRSRRPPLGRRHA